MVPRNSFGYRKKLEFRVCDTDIYARNIGKISIFDNLKISFDASLKTNMGGGYAEGGREGKTSSKYPIHRKLDNATFFRCDKSKV